MLDSLSSPRNSCILQSMVIPWHSSGGNGRSLVPCWRHEDPQDAEAVQLGKVQGQARLQTSAY